MALTLADRIKQYTTSTGTGDVSFTGTPTGFASFSSVLSSGDITYYAIEENDKWEVGVGTYGSDNMVRSQVLDSSNSGSHVDLGGSGVVFITYPSDKATYLNENDEYVLGASGLLFSNGTVFKDAKLTELTDVAISGTVVSTHVFALNNTNKSLLLGDVTGPSNSNNTLIGYGAASGITSATSNVAIGTESAIANNAGIENVSIGTLSGPSETMYTNPASYVVSVGHKAGSRAKSKVTAIGHQAGIAAYETGFVAVGSAAGSGIGSYSVGVGNEAAHGMGSDYVVAVGYQAAKSAAGESAVWVGHMAGASASSSTKSVGIGYQAGKSSSATDSIYIGQSAGQGNSDDDYLYIANGAPSSSRTLIKGDMQSKRLAVGAADVTLEDTFYIGIASSVDKGLVVRSAAGQSDDLTQWQTSAGGSLASVSSLGVITANQIAASGQGLKFLSSQIPTTPAHTLYRIGGTLYWNLNPVTAPTGVNQSVAFYGGLQSAIYSDDLTFDNDSKTFTAGNVSLKDNFINIDDVGKVRIGSYVGDAGITESDYSVILGHYSAVNASGSSYSFFGGYYAGFNCLNSHHSQIIGSSAGVFASGARSIYVGDSAGSYASGDYNVFIGDGAGRKCVGSHNIEIIASGDSSFSPLNGYSNKIHIGQTIIGDTDARKLAFGLVSSSNVSPNATVEIFPKADDLALKVHGSGEFASGIALPSAVPASTTSMLYNDAGTLKFNGSAVGGDVTTAQLVYVSGIAVYASGQAIANEGDIATNVTNISTNVTNIVSTTAVANYASGQAIANESDIVAVSGIAAYASGHAHDTTYVSGIATYASGQAIENETAIATNVSNISTNTSNISTNITNIATNSARVIYASGQAITNKANIVTNTSNISTNTTNITSTTAVANYASGEALSLNAASGQAVYASGNTANIAFGSDVEGDILYHNGTSFTRLAKGTDNHVLTMDGNVPNWEASSGGGGTSAEATYASGQAIENESDIVATSGIANYASGQAITNKASIATNTSNISTNTSNISTNATNITSTTAVANYASGQVNVVDGVAEGSKALVLDSAKSFTGVKDGTFNQFDSWLYSSGVNVGASGITTTGNVGIGTTAPAGPLGVVVPSTEMVRFTFEGGGYAAIAQTNPKGLDLVTDGALTTTYKYGYGIRFLSSDPQFTTTTPKFLAGIIPRATETYAADDDGGMALDFFTSPNNPGVAPVPTGVMTLSEEGKVGIGTSSPAKDLHVYNASATPVVRIQGNTAGNSEAQLHLEGYRDAGSAGTIGTIVFNNHNADVDLGHISVIKNSTSTHDVGDMVFYTAPSDAGVSERLRIQHDGKVGIGTASPSYTLDVFGHDAWVRASGVIVGNSGVVLANNAPAVTTNTLYNDGGTLSWNGSAVGGGGASAEATYASGQAIANESDIVATSGIAAYASGQAITNKASIATNTSNISTNTSNISTNATNITSTTAVANYASGEVVSLNYASGVAAYASGQAIANETDIATNVSNISTNVTNIATNSARVGYASGLAITNESEVAYASGQAIANESDIVATSGIAAYASGQAITNKANVATNTSSISTNTTNIATNSARVIYASGQVNVTTDGTAEASKALILDSAKSFTGVKDGTFNQFDSWLYSSGVNVGASGINTTGNVSIGTVGSSYPLHVNGLSKLGDRGKTEGGLIIDRTSLGTVKGGAQTVLGNAVVPGTGENTIQHSESDAGNFVRVVYSRGISFHTNITTTEDTDVTIETNERMVIDLDGNVGIGTTDPEGKLHISGGNIGAPSSNADTIVIEDVNTDVGISILATAGYNSAIYFGDSNDTDIGRIDYDHNVNSLTFRVNANDRMVIDSAGKVGIGATGPGAMLEVESSSSSVGTTVIKGAASQTADLTSWQTLAGGVVAAMTPSGTLNTYGIIASGNVGIGTGAPNAILDISDAANDNLRIGTRGGNMNLFSVTDAGANSPLAFEGSEFHFITGDVGIGTTNPQQTFDLRGNFVQRPLADGSAVFGITTSGGSNRIRFDTTNGDGSLFLRDNADVYTVYLTSDGNSYINGGNVGIGTTSPSYPLHVVAHSGTIMCSGVRSHLEVKTDAANIYFDIDQSTTHHVVLGGNRTLHVNNSRVGDKFLIRLQQDSSGSRTISWFDHIKWAGGSAPTLTTTGNKADLLGFLAASGTGSHIWYDGLVIGQNI